MCPCLGKGEAARSNSISIICIGNRVLFVECGLHFHLGCCPHMNYCICESALEYDGHADPNIHASEENLLVLFIFLGVVEEDSMEELKIIEFRDFYQLNWARAVTADGCLLSLVSSAEEGVKDVLSGLEILDLFICIADISLPEGEDI